MENIFKNDKRTSGVEIPDIYQDRRASYFLQKPPSDQKDLFDKFLNAGGIDINALIETPGGPN